MLNCREIVLVKKLNIQAQRPNVHSCIYVFNETYEKSKMYCYLSYKDEMKCLEKLLAEVSTDEEAINWNNDEDTTDKE